MKLIGIDSLVITFRSILQGPGDTILTDAVTSEVTEQICDRIHIFELA